ncbi:unnamed protein product [Oikopleura dioica]|uniref:26S proteasome non-ATPase regulatory subunit 8 n=1 Tax=Oikopleura dioica TaxID=34765 RepID=E4XDV1_OIKDI|nr:unnamed protein product [Oikopleura dioica]
MPLNPKKKIFEEAVNLYTDLSQEFKGTNGKPNLESCGAILSKLKLKLTQLNFLPAEKDCNIEKELTLARDVLELGALYSVASRDIPSFQKYIAQVKAYYFDYKDLPKSYFRNQILGLNLLCLLAQNKVAEFHTEVERLSYEEIQSDLYIKHPIKIEQYLMEGNYNRLIQAKSNTPSESYSYFMEMLLVTVRDEIASCIEKAYPNMVTSEVQRLLHLSSDKELQSFSSKRNWDFDQKLINFPREVVKDSIPSKDVTKMMLDYACDLEMII